MSSHVTSINTKYKIEVIDDLLFGICAAIHTLEGPSTVIDKHTKDGMLAAIRQLSSSAKNEISLSAISDIAISKRMNRIYNCLNGISIVVSILEQKDPPDWWTDAKNNGLISLINELSYSATTESQYIHDSFE
ncbi:MAG: hypothetical protein JAY90_07240 [Candidatus Thiodiazotropha lotti]|nr:hypothetical protein [Candidatus Thiodiazotropha lotti]ODB94869.1 hypothetical protein A3197_19235 [Candidatus Thiodiazotropha endoloripes]